MPRPLSTDNDARTSFHQHRHLVLDFTLVDEHGMARNPTVDEFERLNSVLPPNLGKGVMGGFLVVYFVELPPKPWPISVAGLPLFMTTDHFALPPSLGRPGGGGRPALGGRPRRHELEHLDARSAVTRQLFEAVITFFESADFPILEIGWMCGVWRATYDDGADLSNLPSMLCQTGIFYLPKGTHTLNEAASREKIPGPLDRNDTAYSPIRPGLIVASTSLSTTSGVLVEDHEGAVYMTAASHGFPYDETEVYHPNPNGQIIGHVVRRLADTNIALVKLCDDIKFENRTFQSDDEPDGVLLKGIRDPYERWRYDALSMENSFTGLIDAQFLGVNRIRVTTSDLTEHLWVNQLWAWSGQDPDKYPVAESCGSAIYDQDGNIVAFFRYMMNDSGVGVGVAAQELLHMGYSLHMGTKK
ncbi:hypothetical protein TCE0_004r00242 [Talaromyces pinophilus]|uniref:Uncharacterized protein n=1 Tax=Talaromyces pinophilus TaxID=128442 RepID=A0A0B8N274_TALPI|nr:hypothetical protein TCE0_004r00242 [Talaromyces pinophilus]